MCGVSICHLTIFLHQIHVDADDNVSILPFGVLLGKDCLDRRSGAMPRRDPHHMITGIEIAADDETRHGDMLCGTIWPISLAEAFFHGLFTTDSDPA